MDLRGMDRKVLERYLEARAHVTQRVDRVVAVAGLLMLLKQCGDDAVEVSPSALAGLGDLIDSDVCAIQELLDGFIYAVDAEEALAG